MVWGEAEEVEEEGNAYMGSQGPGYRQRQACVPGCVYICGVEYASYGARLSLSKE